MELFYLGTLVGSGAHSKAVGHGLPAALPNRPNDAVWECNIVGAVEPDFVPSDCQRMGGRPGPTRQAYACGPAPRYALSVAPIATMNKQNAWSRC